MDSKDRREEQEITSGDPLYVRKGERIIKAPQEDQAVARSYPGWPNKGRVIEGRRITILTRKTSYDVKEEVRVIHVFEVVDPGHLVYVMGPKPVYGEYVDGLSATPAPPAGEDPLIPTLYNGRVLNSPAVDYNFEITRYTFHTPGTREVLWRLGGLESNSLRLEIKNKA